MHAHADKNMRKHQRYPPTTQRASTLFIRRPNYHLEPRDLAGKAVLLSVAGYRADLYTAR